MAWTNTPKSLPPNSEIAKDLRLSLATILPILIKTAAAPTVRSMSQWAEEEIWIPTGQKAGRFKHSNHPVSRIWFRELDSGYWWRTAVVAPTQNGKTVMGYVIPVLYHLFELKETVIIGLPDMRMANDKWERDFLPMILASQYGVLLPGRGEGSRGGKVRSAVTFTNGAMLRFMSRGGSDKAAAGFSGCRVVAITETDGMDEPGEVSREADRCKQIEARTRGFPEAYRRTYLECTASIEEGKIWTEYTGGTRSRLVRPCPYCSDWVTPERKHLKGWQEAVDEEDAREKAAWHCPECDHAWSQADREWGWDRMLLVHQGQEVTPEGKIVGKPPRTRTLGFRWGAVDNPFTDAGTCGAEEWRALQAKDKTGAEKEILQWTNAMPWVPDEQYTEELDPDAIEHKETEYKRGIVPPNCIGISVGIDTHSRILYWEVKAILRHPDTGVVTYHVVDYGTLKLDATKLAREAILAGLKVLKRQFDGGWIDETGKRWMPCQVWIDSGYAAHNTPIKVFCAAANKGLDVMDAIWRPCKGHGIGQVRNTPYRAPENKPNVKTQTSILLYVGNEYYIVRPKQGKTNWQGAQLVHVNADVWKTAVHDGFSVDAGETGSITLFEDNGSDRDTYKAQICGEKQVEKTYKERGKCMTWVAIGANHYLDTAYLATAAADFVLSNPHRFGPVKQGRKRAEDFANRPSAADMASRYAGRPVAAIPG